MSDVLIEFLPDVLLRPPLHTWAGPQPGLHAQADESRRYYFSQKTGALESIVQYNDALLPEVRVRYRSSFGSNGQPRAFELERWQDGKYESAGLVEQDGRVVQTHSLPRVMLDAHNTERPIDTESGRTFITPAGTVVRLTSEGSLFARPRAEYMGRVKNFAPHRPFRVRAAGTEYDLEAHRQDAVIDPHGFVFEFRPEGLVAIGEIIIPELESDRGDSGNVVRADHDLFTLELRRGEGTARVDVTDEYINDFLEGPLSTIVGRHTFLHQSVPEMVDLHGSDRAERALRDIERRACELGLIFFALRNETRPAHRTAFINAQHILEDALWERVDAFERTLGAARHSVVNPALVRAWVERAAAHPHEALLELKQSVTPRYATAVTA